MSKSGFRDRIRLALAIVCVSWPVALDFPSVDAQETNTTGSDEDSTLKVPDGTPVEITGFVKNLLKGQAAKEFASRQEFVENELKVQRVLIQAADKILAQKTDDKVAVEAVRMKLGAFAVLADSNVDNAARDALAAVTKLKADDRTAVTKAAEEFSLRIRIANAPQMAAEERAALVAEVANGVKSTKFSGVSIEAATHLADVLAAAGQSEEAGQLFDRLSSISTESPDAKFRPNAERFAAIARRMRLPGHFLEVDGKQLDGKPFDWESYRGKVVLVYFWATSSPYCLEDLPLLKQAYQKYHDKGFDIVGISLDLVREPIDKLIAKEGIAWVQLYDVDWQRGKGWNHPLALKYGISAIPVGILVDKEGKVVSMAARGEQLDILLQKRLGSPE